MLSNTAIVNLTGSYNVNAIGPDGSAVANGGIDMASDEFPLAQIGNGYGF